MVYNRSLVESLLSELCCGEAGEERLTRARPRSAEPPAAHPLSQLAPCAFLEARPARRSS